MTNKMGQKIAYLTKKQCLEIQEGSIDILKPDSVKVKVEYVGVCGSDVYFYESGHCGPDELPFPIGLGHECAGTVVEIGAEVTNFKVGDKVCLEPGIPCGKCEFCKSGRYNLCQEVDFMAAPPYYHGALKEYVVHPEHLTFKLPDGLDTMDGALVEPLSVGFHAVERGEAGFGKKVVVLGAGCIGLMTVMACKMMGVTDIVVVDLFEARLAIAKKVGATQTIDASQVDTVDMMKKVYPQGADIVFETAGSIPTTRQTGALVKAGGTIVLVGNTHGDVPYDFFEIMNKEITVKCVFRYSNSYPKVIDAIKKGIVNPKEIVTNEYTFEEVNQAFQDSINNKRDIVKAIIKMD